MKNQKIQTPFSVTRKTIEDQKVEERRLRSGSLLALLVVYLFLFAFEAETTVYGWAVLAVICVLSFVMVVIWLIELKDGKI